MSANHRTHMTRMGIAFVIAAIVAPIGLGPAVQSTFAAIPAPNPPIDEACGVNVTLVLDASGSIESAHAVEDVRDSAEVFLDALADTNSRARVIDFGTVARETAGMELVTTPSLRPGGVHREAIDAYYNPKPPLPAGVEGHRYDGSGNPLSAANYRDGDDPQYTNWDESLRLSRGDATNLIVFVTDGEPSAIDADQPGDPFRAVSGPPDVLYGLTGGTAVDLALDRAVEESNVAKGQGARVLAIGVGSAFGPGSSDNRARLVAVAGPQVVTDADDITDLNAVDVALVADFDELHDVLHSVVTQLCSPSLTIRKLGQTAEDASYRPVEGWGITVDPQVTTVANPPLEWVKPEGLPVGPATLTTDVNGFVTFQWDPLPPSATTIAHVTEEDRGTTTPFDWLCQSEDADGQVTTTSGTLDPVTPGFDVTVGPEAIVTCGLRNAFDYAPGVAVEKTNAPTRVRGDGEGTVVTSTYVVTNTGNAPLAPDSGIDDRCAPIDLVSGDDDDDFLLDTDETWTLTCDRVVKSETTDGPPVVIDNTVTVVGVAPDLTTVSATDSAGVLVLTPNIFIDKTASPTQVVGSGTVTYTFEVTTTGNMPIDDVVVNDDACAPVAFESGDDGDGLLEDGETWTYTCATTVSEPTVDTATVEGQPLDLGAPLGATVTASDTAEVTVIDPRMRLIKTVDPIVALPGRTVTYSFELVNTSGDGSALVPVAGGSPVDAVTDDQCDPVVFDAGSDAGADSVLSDGETWTYTCTASYDDPGLVVNVATADMAVQGDPATVLTRQDIAFVVVLGASIDLTKTPSSGLVHAGDSVTYTYEASNTGLLPLANVGVDDDLCGAATLLPGGDDDGDGLLEIPEVWVFECTMTLDPTDGDPTAAETITNTATVTGTPRLGGEDGEPVTDAAEAEVDIIQPALDVQKVADPTEVRLGQATTYTITVTNTGDTGLVYGFVSDTMCEPLTLTDDGDGDHIAAPGEIWTYVCTSRPSSFTTNTVDVFGIDRLALVVPGTDSADVDVFDPAIDLVKTVSDDIVERGTTVTYTFVATNTGDDPLANVTLVDDQCADPVLQSDGNGDTVLDPAEAWTWTCDAQISADIVNVAVVSGDDRTDLPVFDTDQATVAAYEGGIAITKSPTPAVVVESGAVTYTYLVTNTGNVPLANVVDSITDDTCPDVTYVSGDIDANELLTGVADLFEVGPPETWRFECTVDVSVDTTNTVTVAGTPSAPGADGVEPIGPDVTDAATAAVDVLAPATITIVKQLTGQADGQAAFTGDLGTFQIDVAATSASATFDLLAPGVYAVRESPMPGWSLTSIACDDPSGGTSAVRPAATIDLAEGESVSCTFTNAKLYVPPTDIYPFLPPVVAELVVGATPFWPILLGGLGGLVFALWWRRRGPSSRSGADRD